MGCVRPRVTLCSVARHGATFGDSSTLGFLLCRGFRIRSVKVENQSQRFPDHPCCNYDESDDENPLTPV